MPEALAKSPQTERDLAAACDRELAERNSTALFWSHLAFSALYLLWWSLDLVEAPEHATRFLIYRLLAVAAATMAAFGPMRTSGVPVQSWLATSAWFLVWGGTVAVMLPHISAHANLLYVVGLSAIGLGAGVLPFWPSRWAIGTVVAIGVAGACGLALRPQVAVAVWLEAGITYLTIGAGAVIVSVLKYRFFRLSFERRVELEATSHKLETALEQLKELDQQKTRLFHNVSHELRTPLTMIIAPLDDIANGAPHRMDVFAMMRRNAKRLLRLVDDILELSKIESEGLPLQVGRVDLAELGANVTATLMPGAESRKIDLRCERVEGELWGHVDAYRIETVLTNLIGNAIKYTPDGGTVIVRVDGDQEAVRFRVEDTGPGVPEEMVERIFERYVQVGEKAVGGVGIGLSLARELVELHGGKIGVETKHGEGSCFWFELPREHLSFQPLRPRRPSRNADSLQNLVAAAPEDPSANELHGTVLVVDDERDVRELVTQVLRSRCNVLEAVDGMEALSIIRAQKPDVVITDMMMPGLDGAGLLREVRADLAIAHTPVIFLTAAGEVENETAILRSGADDYIAKPFFPEVLRARVELQLRLRGLIAGLANQEKLAAIGTLTAGILHEVNNPAGCIVAASSLIRTDVGEEKLKIAHDIIRDAADRIVKLTAALRSHARPAEQDIPKPFDLKQGIESSLALLAHTIGHRMEVLVECADGLEVFGPPAATNHVILNLIENASKSGAANASIIAKLVSDGEVEVAVQDDGPGVPKRNRERIFDPFFTTRAVGDGTGLGLFLCRKTLQENGGSIVLEPSTAGARFVLRLKTPPVDEPVFNQRPRGSSDRPSAPPLS